MIAPAGTWISALMQCPKPAGRDIRSGFSYRRREGLIDGAQMVCRQLAAKLRHGLPSMDYPMVARHAFNRAAARRLVPVEPARIWWRTWMHRNFLDRLVPAVEPGALPK